MFLDLVNQTSSNLQFTLLHFSHAKHKQKKDNLHINTLDVVDHSYMTTIVKEKERKMSRGTLLGLLLQQPTVH